MRLSIRHQTHYAYATPLERGVQMVRLWPAPHAGLSSLRWDVRAQGARVGRSFLDGYGNRCALADLTPHAVSAEIVVEGAVETRDTMGRTEGAAEPLPASYFLRVTPRTEADEAIRMLSSALTGSASERGLALMKAVRERVEFRAGVTSVDATAAEALQKGEGVCQDHAHIFCAAARVVGMPARYVSGYLFTGGAESPASHAWVEAFDGETWIGLDPANCVSVNDYYVRLAVGLDYREAAPIIGVRAGGGEETLSVSVRVMAQQ